MRRSLRKALIGTGVLVAVLGTATAAEVGLLSLMRRSEYQTVAESLPDGWYFRDEKLTDKAVILSRNRGDRQVAFWDATNYKYTDIENFEEIPGNYTVHFDERIGRKGRPAVFDEQGKLVGYLAYVNSELDRFSQYDNHVAGEQFAMELNSSEESKYRSPMRKFIPFTFPNPDSLEARFKKKHLILKSTIPKPRKP